MALASASRKDCRLGTVGRTYLVLDPARMPSGWKGDEERKVAGRCHGKTYLFDPCSLKEEKSKIKTASGARPLRCNASKSQLMPRSLYWKLGTRRSWNSICWQRDRLRSWALFSGHPSRGDGHIAWVGGLFGFTRFEARASAALVPDILEWLAKSSIVFCLDPLRAYCSWLFPFSQQSHMRHGGTTLWEMKVMESGAFTRVYVCVCS